MQRAIQRTRSTGLTSLLLAGVLALGLAACGDDGGDEPVASDETARDDDMDMADDEGHHEEEGEVMEHDEPNTLSLEPGGTGELTWHFRGSGEVLYACHEPGHYAGGMVGSISISIS